MKLASYLPKVVSQEQGMGIGGKKKPAMNHEAFGTKIGEGDDAINPNDLLELMVRAESPSAEEANREKAEDSEQELNKPAARKPIISIHGKDVDESELEKSDRPKKDAA